MDCYLHKQTFVFKLEKGAGILGAIFIGKEEKHFGSKTEVKLSGRKYLKAQMFLRCTFPLEYVHTVQGTQTGKWCRHKGKAPGLTGKTCCTKSCLSSPGLCRC